MASDVPSRRPTLGRRILFRIGAVLVSLVILAAMLEIGTRLLLPESTFNVFTNVFVRDSSPRIRYTLRPSYEASAFGVDLVTNSLGFRGREWITTRPPGSLRIALIGDSHAFGFGVKFEQTMGELLAKRLQTRLGRPVELMNFGVNGYNTQQELAVLETKALPLAPELVLILPCNNDDNSPLWVDAEGYLRAGNEAKANSKRKTIGFSRFSRFALWMRVLELRHKMSIAAPEVEAAEGVTGDSSWMPPAGTGPVDEALRGPVFEPLASMIDLSRERGASVAILTFATPLLWRSTLNALASEKEVPLLELIPLLDGIGNWEDIRRKWSLGWDSHMAAPAQEVWAAKVEEFLLAHGLVQ